MQGYYYASDGKWYPLLTGTISGSVLRGSWNAGIPWFSGAFSFTQGTIIGMHEIKPLLQAEGDFVARQSIETLELFRYLRLLVRGDPVRAGNATDLLYQPQPCGIFAQRQLRPAPDG